MHRIVSLTMNPTIDGACEAERVQPTHKVRTTNERFDPGGGGINVARVAAELGERVRAVYLAGGVTGALLDELLARRGLDATRVPIAGDTRMAHAVFERSTGLEYRFVPEGPEIAEAEWRGCLDTLAALPCEWIVASGSLPRGVPEDFYVRVGAIARRTGARLVLDSSGPALRAAVEAGVPYLVKPSLGEFEQLVGRTLSEPAAQEAAARAFVHGGKVALLAVTLGHRGALLASRDGLLRLPPIPVEVRSAVGAGDSFVAGMTVALARGEPAEAAFRLGVAAGTAAVLTPGTELARGADIRRMLTLL